MATDVHGDDGFQFDLFGPGEEDCNIQNGIIHSEVAKVNSKVLNVLYDMLKQNTHRGASNFRFLTISPPTFLY